MGIFKLLKYAAYIELFQRVGQAIDGGKNGDNFDISSGLSIKGKRKVIHISMNDA